MRYEQKKGLLVTSKRGSDCQQRRAGWESQLRKARAVSERQQKTVGGLWRVEMLPPHRSKKTGWQDKAALEDEHNLKSRRV